MSTHKIVIISAPSFEGHCITDMDDFESRAHKAMRSIQFVQDTKTTMLDNNPMKIEIEYDWTGPDEHFLNQGYFEDYGLEMVSV